MDIVTRIEKAIEGRIKTAELREKFHTSVKGFEEQFTTVQTSVKSLNSSAVEAWRDIKVGADRVWKETYSTFQKVMADFGVKTKSSGGKKSRTVH